MSLSLREEGLIYIQGVISPMHNSLCIPPLCLYGELGVMFLGYLGYTNEQYGVSESSNESVTY